MVLEYLLVEKYLSDAYLMVKDMSDTNFPWTE